MSYKLYAYEHEAQSRGYSRIAGIDEAGRGPLAGPVVAAAVILGKWGHPGIGDSKKIAAGKRELLFEQIMEHAAAVGIGITGVGEIDSINIYNAAKTAMCKAVSNLYIQPDFLLIDAMKLPIDISQLAIIKGDALSISIGAASIIAKVSRDRIMLDLHDKYPQYGFNKHKGYGTALHLQKLKEYGPCSFHRKSFSPVKQWYADKQ